MKRKLENLQKNIRIAAWLCVLPPPLGVDEPKWNAAIEALYAANQSIDNLLKSGFPPARE